MWQLHAKKGKDYGIEEDLYHNVNAAEEFAIPAWVGALLRQNEKITRIKAFRRNGSLANESLRDSLIDNCVYAAIALLLYDTKNP